MRDFFRPGRSVAAGLACAVASSHAIASAVALGVLERGGNAVDAAVAATFTLCVVEPQSTGIGGDCFALLMPRGAEKPVGFNGSGRSPRGLDPVAAQAAGGAPLAETSVHAVTVPGLVDGLAQLLERHGTLSLAAALEPAIGYAEGGFVVAPRVAEEWAFVRDKLAATPPGREALLFAGKAPRQGAVVKLPALAATLRAIASGGADAFYRGEAARSMASFLKSMGGFHAVADFEAHEGRFVEPVRGSYRGRDVWQIPPNGQGVTTLMLLRLLEEAGPPPGDFDGAERHRLLAAAARAAFRERDRVIADPDFAPVPLEGFLAGNASPAAADIATPPARGDTAYVSVVDRERNAVSLISSLFEGFGTGLYDPGTGVVFHNRGSGFSALAGHPNALAPFKRPLHTIIPGMVTHEGRVVLSFGVTGGPYQPIGQSQVISALLDYGMDIQEAIDRPRSFLLKEVLQLEPDLLALGPALREAGFAVQEAPRAVGGAHGIAVDWERGTLSGGSDPRKDGCALAL